MSSSVIARVAYDEESHTLHEELIEAESAGGYFADNIRNVYRFERR